MNARDYLRRVKTLNDEINNKLVTLRHLKQMMTNISSPGTTERVQTSSNQSKMDKLVCKAVDLEREIDAKTDDLVDLKCEVLSVLQRLEPTEFDVLQQYYIEGKQIYEIAHKNGNSDSWAYTVRKRAERHLQTILDKMENSGCKKL